MLHSNIANFENLLIEDSSIHMPESSTFSWWLIIGRKAYFDWLLIRVLRSQESSKKAYIYKFQLGVHREEFPRDP